MPRACCSAISTRSSESGRWDEALRRAKAMSSRRPPWSVLGLDAGADAGAIRKAYASRLKAIDPDTDPAGFARLREARETALRLARRAGPLADPAPAFIDEAPPAAIWPYAAPDFDAGPASGDAALTVNVSLPGSEAIPAPATIIGQARSEPPAATPIVDPFATVICPPCERSAVANDRVQSPTREAPLRAFARQ